MRKTAGFLHVLTTIGVILFIVALAVIALAEGFMFAAGDLSGLAQAGITVDAGGAALTAQDLASMKPLLMSIIAFAFVLVLIGLLTLLKVRKVLAECKESRPFSEVCCKSLKGAARLEILGGIIGILGTIAIFILGVNFSLNGTPIGDTTITLNLSFIVTAVLLYLLYHVAEYGKSLEK